MSRINNPWAGMLELWISTLLFLTYFRFTYSALNEDNNSIYRESPSRANQPPECRRTTKPAYYLENTEDEYRLVVTIPEQVSRKKLKIDVDYDNGHIEVFGWWFEGKKIRGDDPPKMCVYGVWEIDPELLSEEAIVSSDLVSVYDMFMSMRDQQLILTVPMAIQQNIPSVAEDPVIPPLASPISNERQDEVENQSIEHHTSIVVDYGTSLWKKFRGLVRVKDHARSNYFYYSKEFDEKIHSSASAWSLWDFDAGLPPSSLAYEKYRQDALEDFLTYTAVTTMVQDSN